MVASVAETEDPHGTPLSFVWRLLHGDEDRVRITPLDPRGTRAEIVVSRDAKGEPAETRGVRYGRKQSGPDAMPELIPEPDPAAR